MYSCVQQKHTRVIYSISLINSTYLQNVIEESYIKFWCYLMLFYNKCHHYTYDTEDTYDTEETFASELLENLEKNVSEYCLNSRFKSPVLWLVVEGLKLCFLHALTFFDTGLTLWYVEDMSMFPVLHVVPRNFKIYWISSKIFPCYC